MARKRNTVTKPQKQKEQQKRSHPVGTPIIERQLLTTEAKLKQGEWERNTLIPLSLPL
jgi:hypothetical protein